MWSRVTYLLDSEGHSARLHFFFDDGIDDGIFECGCDEAIAHDVEINECLPFLVLSFGITLNLDSSLFRELGVDFLRVKPLNEHIEVLTINVGDCDFARESRPVQGSPEVI